MGDDYRLVLAAKMKRPSPFTNTEVPDGQMD
jgi:hypothetical protein